MLDDIYKIDSSEDFLSYDFESVGTKGTIKKIVRYNQEGTTGIFNLGFGDVCPETQFEDDLAVTNNGDSKKILKTVASTLYTFTEHYPRAVVVASGSTDVRTRLYQIAISNNIKAISRDFTVWGYYQGDWIPFDTGTPYKAFLVRRKL